MDADVLEDLLHDPEPEKKAKEVELKILRRLREHDGEKQFIELGERLEALRDRHEQGLLHSLEYLKALAELAKDVVQAEREVVPEEEHDLGKAALSELFESTKTPDTPVIVERARSSRRCATLLSYKLHKDQELFEKAYGYIKQYY